MASSPKPHSQPTLQAGGSEARLELRTLVLRRAADPIDGVAALRDAAVRVDGIRCSNTNDHAGDHEPFARLVDGRWTLVDRFDRGGRHYLVARFDTCAGGPPAGLTRRERQVTRLAILGYSNKQIAYTLRLAPSTVSSHLRTAMRRLGVTNRAELAACVPARPSRLEGDR